MTDLTSIYPYPQLLCVFLYFVEVFCVIILGAVLVLVPNLDPKALGPNVGSGEGEGRGDG